MPTPNCMLDPDLVVEVMASSSSSQSARPSSSSSVSRPRTNQNQSRNSGQLLEVKVLHRLQVLVHIQLLCDGIVKPFNSQSMIGSLLWLSLQFFLWFQKNLSNRLYRLSFMGTGCSSLYSLYSLYGALQVHFQTIFAAEDFVYFIYSLTFVTSNLYLKFALIPILCRTLEHVAKFLRRNFNRSSLYMKYLEEPCVWVESNTSILSSEAEIALGFLLIISLLSWQRNFIQTFMYWQLLKLMYHAPVTAGYHRSAGQNLGELLIPSFIGTFHFSTLPSLQLKDGGSGRN